MIFSKHALSRAVDMCVHADELKSIVDHPKMKWESQKYPGTWYLTNYRVVLAVGNVDPDGNECEETVATVLWYRLPSLGRFTRSLDEDLEKIRDPKSTLEAGDDG